MRAAVVRGVGEVALETVPTPEVHGRGQVLVRNLVSSVCGSDLHVVDVGQRPAGSPPGYPGHESVGVVTASSDGRYAEGDLVLCVPDLVHAGGFAESQLLPADLVLPLPAGATPETVLLAQQLGTVLYAMKRFWPSTLPGADTGTAVVLGAGPVGLFFTRVCRLAGFPAVITSDLHPHRLEAARRMGATRTVDARAEDVVEVVRAETTDGAELVVEGAGTDSTRVQAIGCVADSGRIGMFGMPSGADLTIPFERLFRRRPTVEFCWGAQAEPGHASFREALELIADGRVDTAPLALQLWPFEELPDALRCAAAGGPEVVKVGVRFP